MLQGNRPHILIFFKYLFHVGSGEEIVVTGKSITIVFANEPNQQNKHEKKKKNKLR